MMVVFQSKEGFSAFSTLDDPFIAAMGPTFDEFLDNLMNAINLTFEDEDLQYSLDEISLISSHKFDKLRFGVPLKPLTKSKIKTLKKA